MVSTDALAQWYSAELEDVTSWYVCINLYNGKCNLVDAVGNYMSCDTHNIIYNQNSTVW